MKSPKPIDIMTEFSKFGLEQQISLRDPAALLKFSKHVADEAKRALADPILVHGQRAEAMFQALVVCLGEFKLLKKDDAGMVFPENNFEVPDFRVVLNDGENWLIEVKNFYNKDPRRQEKKFMTSAYHQKMTAYAEATGAQLKLAVFWARWEVWTLVSPDKLADKSGNVTLDIFQAMKANELARLGDKLIGTKFPLRLRLVANPEKTSPIGTDGFVTFVLGEVKVYCGETEVVNPVEREIAWIFMRYGRWALNKPHAEVDGNQLNAINFVWEPEEKVEDQEFEIIGSLSEMFVRHFAEATVKNNEVVQTNALHRPSWFESIVSNDCKSDQLPLWQFTILSNFD